MIPALLWKIFGAIGLVLITWGVLIKDKKKERILKGVQNVAKRYTGELKSLKKVMGPVAFNLKYGTTLSNYEDIAGATKDKEIKKLITNKDIEDIFSGKTHLKQIEKNIDRFLKE